jgi:hypothetical protein
MAEGEGLEPYSSDEPELALIKRSLSPDSFTLR